MQRYVVLRAITHTSPYFEEEYCHGHLVFDTEAKMLTSIHLFDMDEATKIARSHNDACVINEHWPEQDDPDVQAILNSPEFQLDETLTWAYAVHQASETVARRRAGLEEANA